MNVSTFEIVGEGLKKKLDSEVYNIKKNQVITITSETIPKSSHNSPTV